MCRRIEVDDLNGFTGRGDVGRRERGGVLGGREHPRRCRPWAEPEGEGRTVPEIALDLPGKSAGAARAPTERHGERQARPRAWMATGEPLLSRRPLVVHPSIPPHGPPTRARSRHSPRRHDPDHGGGFGPKMPTNGRSSAAQTPSNRAARLPPNRGQSAVPLRLICARHAAGPQLTRRSTWAPSW